MPIGIHIELNVICCLFCILLYFQQRKHKAFDFLGTAEFNLLIWTVVCITIVDIVFWLMMGEKIPHNDISIMIVQSLYYLIQAFLPLFFFTYCIHITGKTITPLWRILMYIPAVLTIVVLGMNLNSGFALSVASDNLVRGPHYLLLIIAPMIYVFDSLLLCIIFYCRNFNGTSDKRKVSFHILICVIICFIGAVASALASYLSPWIVFITALLYLYLNLHSHREHQLFVMAHTDPLTGFQNYAVFSRIRMQKDREIEENNFTRFAVAFMDINDLKKVNDAYGHEAGDALIIAASKLIANVFKENTICRLGGDEFITVLEGKDYLNRDGLQQLFVQEMKDTTFMANGVELPVSVSIGIASYAPDFHKCFDDVADAADEIMYNNKNLHRAAVKAAQQTK